MSVNRENRYYRAEMYWKMCPRTVLLKLRCAPGSPGLCGICGFWLCSLGGLGLMRFCISNKLLGNADDAGSGTVIP